MAESAADDLYDLPPGIDASEAAPALARCWPDVDSIETDGERRGERFICLAWARGACAQGARCSMRHRLPTLADEQRLLYSSDGLTFDVFGRPRAQLGERSVFDPLSCSTLCLRGLPSELNQQERRRALDSLSEWGEIAKTWIVADPTVGYVRFKRRGAAQIAAEAMQGQPLTPDLPGALQLSWCFSDPSAIQAGQAKEMALAAMGEAHRRRKASAALYEQLEREHRQPGAGGAKRPRERCDEAAQPARPSPAAPVDGAAEAAAAWVEQPEEAVSAVAASYPGCGHSDGSCDDQLPAPAAASAMSGSTTWQSALDPATGHWYYYDMASGQSVWAQPATPLANDTRASSKP